MEKLNSPFENVFDTINHYHFNLAIIMSHKFQIVNRCQEICLTDNILSTA